jgi:hypothetical protein
MRWQRERIGLKGKGKKGAAESVDIPANPLFPFSFF